MKRKKFKKICLGIQEFYKRVNQVGIFSTVLVEAVDPLAKVVEDLFEEIIEEEGLIMFNWFMYEKDFYIDKLRTDLTATDAEGNEILTTLDGLYDYLKENNYFKKGKSKKS